MGNIVWRFMKASPDTVGWAIGVFVSAVILQLAYVTRAGILRYHSIAEGSRSTITFGSYIVKCHPLYP